LIAEAPCITTRFPGASTIEAHNRTAAPSRRQET
jgi:hypothetical protein